MMKYFKSYLLVFVAILSFLGTSAFGTDDIETINIHGFISQGYLDATKGNNYLSEGTADGTFQFNEMGINFSTHVTRGLKIGAQFLAFDIGELGNDEILLDWGVADYKYNDWLGIRAGLIKIPHGFYNETRDIDLGRSTVFLPSSVYGEMFRDAFTRLKGGGVYGELPLGFSYEAIYGTVQIDPSGGLSSGYENLLNRLQISITDTSVNSAYVLSMQWTSPYPGFRLGGSYYEVQDFVLESDTSKLGAPVTIKNKDFVAMAFSMELFWQGFRISVEYTQDFLNFDVTAPPDNSLVAIAFPGGDITTVDKILEGYYGALTYRFFPFLEGETYYSEFYLDKDDKSGKKTYGDTSGGKPVYQAYLKDFCIAARFDINENWIIKLETHFMNGSWTVISGDDPFGVAKHWNLHAVKVTYNF